MDVGAVHGYILGFGVIGSWVVIGLWALVLRLAKREEAPLFWRAVSAAQILLAAQAVFGLVLVLFGRRPGPDLDLFTLVFHLSYGVLLPLVVLFFAHKFARDGRINPYTAFALVGLVNFGLTFRAWQVGVFGG